MSEDRNNLDKLAELTDALSSLEFKLERSNALLAALVHDAGLAIIAKDFTGTVTVWNRAAEDVYGWRSIEMVGKHISAIIPEDKQEELYWLMAQVKNGQVVRSLDTERLHRDGTRLRMWLTISPIYDSRGQIIGASSIAVRVEG